MASTPRRNGTLTPYVPKRSAMGRSFENLVALANHQERLKEARKMVWRGRGEPVAELHDLWDCAEHAVRGGFRAGAMAFSIRASINLVLALIQLRSAPKRIRFALIRHALLGPDAFRFGSMLAAFVSVYKFLLNGLPIVFPKQSKPSSKHSLTSILPRAQGRLPNLSFTPLSPASPIEIPAQDANAHLSLSAQAHHILVRKKTRRWHAVLAGAIAGGLAVMCEKKGRRQFIAQQFFVRGLQGSYNSFTHKHGITVPHGDAMVFSLACAQILYAFLLRPDTLPRSYSTWINQAGKITPECVKMNRDLVRSGAFDLADLETVIGYKDITPTNRTTLQDLYKQASLPIPEFGRWVAPCAAIHPPIDSCLNVPLPRFLEVFKWMLPIYGALHLIPKVLFKRHDFMKDPWAILMKAGWGATRSSAFLGVFVVIYQSFFCFKHDLHNTLSSVSPTSPFKLPQALIDILISKPTFALGGFLSGLSIFVEEKRRRGELAMYVLPKGLESAWVMARGKGWVFRTGQYGEIILTTIGMGMVMSTYQNDPQHLSGLVRRVLYQFIGPN